MDPCPYCVVRLSHQFSLDNLDTGQIKLDTILQMSYPLFSDFDGFVSYTPWRTIFHQVPMVYLKEKIAKAATVGHFQKSSKPKCISGIFEQL